MSNWYYLVNGQQEGPIPEAELLQKLTGGQIPNETFVWRKGMQDWLRANEVDGLISQSPAADAPPAPAASKETSAATTLTAALADDEPVAEAAAGEPASAGKLSLAKKEGPAEPAPQPAAGAPGPAPLIGRPDMGPTTQAEAAYLYISPFRLIFMSIFSFGIYEIYWIYKNWKYAKQRDGLDIMPFWRGWFGIFHCHSLMRFIHMDKVLNRWAEPRFKPGLLATIWVIMQVMANFSGQVGSQEFSTADLLGPLWPSFLCFLPVQLYINKVNREMAPDAKKTGFTLGHIVITLFSLMIWGIVIASVFFSEALMKYLETMPQQ